MNTCGHTQWFYFAVANGQRGVTYKFNILNMVKPDSLFNFGLQVCRRRRSSLHLQASHRLRAR